MARKKLKLIIAGTMLIVIVLALVLAKIVTAGSSDPTVNWFGGTPVVDEEVKYSSTPPSMQGCTKMTLPVQRSLTSAPFEEQCYVPTAMGLMTQLYYKYGVVQPQGYAKAYPVNYQQGGNPIIDPIPNQASGIWMIGYSQGPGMIYGYYPQISNILKLTINTTGVYYSIPVPSWPAFVFSKPGNVSAPFNSSTKSMSKNGRYMVIDGLGAGFIRINLMNLTVKSFAPTLIRINGYSLTGAATAVDDTGRYAAIAYNAPGDWGSKYFKLVDINSCPNPEVDYNVIPDQSSFNCQSLDLLAVLRQRVPTVQTVGNIQFTNERTMTFNIGYTDAGVTKYARYSMTASGQVKRTKNYLALGDSYISGEGAYSYREGTDTGRNECHQSLLSYPYLLSNNFSSFASVACSGARMQHVQDNREDRFDQLQGGRATEDEMSSARQNHTPGAIAQMGFVDKDNPEAVTISIGGNDIGFGEIMKKCISPIKHIDIGETEIELEQPTCYNTYEDRAEKINDINSKFPALRQLYVDLKNDGAAGRRVYVIGYPQVAKVGGDCGTNVQMNADEIAFAHDLIVYMNGVIKKAADEAGVFYVDTQSAFDGHRLCEASAGQAAMNGATVSRSANGGYDFKASFHPNQRGHQMLATAIASQTSNLTAPMPAVPSAQTSVIALDPNATILQNVPKTGRALRYVRTVTNLIDNVVHPLDSIDFTLDSREYLIKASGVYNLVINSTPVNLGNFTADAQGNLTVHSAIPANMPAGFHTLHVYGNDQFGSPIDIEQVIFVTSGSQGDADGDGVSDETDKCILATQSNVDVDKDGIDDVCDPLIDTPPVQPPGGGNGGEPEGIIWWDKVYIPITIKAVSGA